LPDFPEVKRRLGTVITARMRSRSRFPLGISFPTRRHIEGDQNRIARSDGTSTSRPYAGFESRVVLPTDRELGFDDVMRRFDQCADELTEQTARYALRFIEKAVTASGNVEQTRGPLTPEALLRALQKMDMEFLADGSLRPGMALLVSPQTAPAAQKALDQIRDEAHLRAQYDSILNEKWRQWLDRESHRRLVG
jgi:hypothetical protein